MTLKRIRLVHITTVPYALSYLAGQVGYMKARGFEVYSLSSPGELLSVFFKEGRHTSPGHRDGETPHSYSRSCPAF